MLRACQKHGLPLPSISSLLHDLPRLFAAEGIAQPVALHTRRAPSLIVWSRGNEMCFD